MPAAVEQLLKLDGEFDVANPSSPQLDLGSRQALDIHATLYPALEGLKLADSAMVDVLRIYERPHLFEEEACELHVAGDRTRLDERLSLPPFAETFVVIEMGVERAYQGPLASHGAQSHVHSKQVALLHVARKRVDAQLGHFRKKLLIGNRVFSLRLAVMRVHERQVDVRAVVELLPAKLPECHDRY